MTAGAANAADINFAASVAEQYGRYGVRVNTVNPGPVNTDRWDSLEKAFARDKQVDQARAHELAVGSIPLDASASPTRWRTWSRSSPRLARASSTAPTSPSTAPSAKR